MEFPHDQHSRDSTRCVEGHIFVICWRGKRTDSGHQTNKKIYSLDPGTGFYSGFAPKP